MHNDQLRFKAAVFALVVCACAPADDTADSAAGQDTATATGSQAAADTSSAFTIANAGFVTPESVLHDEQADVYFVSNINGEALGRDDNGFISRVRPDGTVEQLAWIDGASDSVTLNAPKGMAVHGDTLFVADIDSVRAFHRTTGAPLGARPIAGAAFLNDLAVAADGTLYVTDTGVDASFSPNGQDAVYRVGGAEPEPVAQGRQLGNPNGIVVEDGGIVMVPFGSAVVMRIPLDSSAADTLATLPAGQLDGIVRTRDGSYVVSSWEGSALYRIAPDGSVSTLAENLSSPADIGYDAARNRVLVPLFNRNEVRIVPVR
jgi:sugar lactone lactonase YvrE